MSWMTAHLQAMAWKVSHRPVYAPGQKVVNRYSGLGGLLPSAPQTLKSYVGPDVGYQEDHWAASEQWLTESGDLVDVGFFWRPI